jgi:hypothetical protein
MKERAVTFGPSGHLSGILCEPVQPRAGAPAALLWNMGIHHRVGSFRIWVDLARRLARAGFISLRFDLGGMGDSGSRQTFTEDLSRAEDLDDAMAVVTRRTGIATFAPIGFCSGVDQLHPLGLRDSRVVAMGYIEGYAWQTPGFWLRYPLRYLRGPLWREKLARLSDRKGLAKLKGLLAPKRLPVDPIAMEEAAGAAMFSRHPPDRLAFARDLCTLLGRDVKLFFAFFGLEGRFTHEGQFEEMTGIKPGRGRGLELFFLGGADHLLMHVEDRALTLSRVVEWLSAAFA